MKKSVMHVAIIMGTFFSSVVAAAPFVLSSSDIKEGERMGIAQEYQGFGCDGKNISPQLSWSGEPEGTASFAVFAYDPDAPTGSGWWHWQVVNIPSTVHGLDAGAGDVSQAGLPTGSIQMNNDFGVQAFGGACPPTNGSIHRYRFTVYALSTVLDVPPNASSALIGYMVNAHALAKSTIEATYKRD